MAEKEKPKSTISRRTFLGTVGATAVVGVAAGAAIGYLASPRTPDHLVLKIPSSWDHQTDVVVVGAGGAGLSAALGALESGAKVIVLEKGSAVGGTTAISGGGLWIPNNSISTAAGQTEPLSQLVQYLNSVGEGQQDQDLINTYLQQGPIWVDHIIQVSGLKFSLETFFGDYYNKPGGQGIVHWIGADGAGAGLIKALKSVVDSKGATTMLNTAATALYQDAMGRIVGVKATSGSSSINISVAKGVILCAGGMDWNKEMLLNYMRGPIDISSAPNTITGDGIQMGMAAGALMHNMNNAWGWPTYITPNGAIPDAGDGAGYRTKPGAIVVNRFGKRFANESCGYPVFNRAFHQWDTGIFDYINHPAYTIIDSDFLSRYGFVGVPTGATVPSYIASASTLQDLATALGIDAAGLQATVTLFNTYAVNGVDPDFHRGEWFFDKNTGGDPSRTDLKNDCLAPLQTPPFYGIEIHPGLLGTCGGPKINSNGQILDQSGNPIPGLYGAGNDIASPFGAAYPSGGATIGAATTFGWIAGKSAGSS